MKGHPLREGERKGGRRRGREGGKEGEKEREKKRNREIHRERRGREGESQRVHTHTETTLVTSLIKKPADE